MDNDFNALEWVYAVTLGITLPGEYVPQANPLDVMTGG